MTARWSDRPVLRPLAVDTRGDVRALVDALVVEHAVIRPAPFDWARRCPELADDECPELADWCNPAGLVRP